MAEHVVVPGVELGGAGVRLVASVVVAVAASGVVVEVVLEVAAAAVSEGGAVVAAVTENWHVKLKQANEVLGIEECQKI